MHNSKLQHCRDVEPSWFPKTLLHLLAPKSSIVLTSRFNSFWKTCGIWFQGLVLEAFLANRYTSYNNSLSLRQEVVSKASSNPPNDKQAKLTLNLHSYTTIDTKCKPQRRKQDKLVHTKPNSIIYWQPNLLSVTFLSQNH